MSGADSPTLPWRKRYPRDLQTDMRRRLLGLEGQAALDNLLDAAWLADGTLPADSAILAQVSQAGDRWPSLASKVLAYFERRGDVYVNAELTTEMAEGERRVEINRERAKAGAAARWGVDAPGNAPSIPASNAGNDACVMPPSAVQPSAVQEQRRKRTSARSARGATSVPDSKRSTDGNGDGALKTTADLYPWPTDWTRRLIDVWRPHGDVAGGRLGKALGEIKGRRPFEDVERGLRAYLAAGKAQYGPEAFARSVGDCIDGRGIVVAAAGVRRPSVGEQAMAEALKARSA